MSAVIIDTIESRWSGEIEISVDRGGADRSSVVCLCIGDGAQCTIGEFTVDAAEQVMRAIGNALGELGRPLVPALPRAAADQQRIGAAAEDVQNALKALWACPPIREERSERQRVVEYRTGELLPLLTPTPEVPWYVNHLADCTRERCAPTCPRGATPPA